METKRTGLINSPRERKYHATASANLENQLDGGARDQRGFPAYDRELDRHVALKRVKDTRALDGELAELVGQRPGCWLPWSTPNIVPVHDSGIGRPGPAASYTMKLLAGSGSKR